MPTIPLRKSDLLNRIVEAIETSQWSGIVLNHTHPFVIRIQRQNEQYTLRVCIWNCTRKRPIRHFDGAYCIRSASPIPKFDSRAVNLLLGWHDGIDLFLGFDLTKYQHWQPPGFRSTGIQEAELVRANGEYLTIIEKRNREIIFAVHPAFLCEYAIHSARLHRLSNRSEDVQMLEEALAKPFHWEPIPSQALPSPNASLIRAIKRRIADTDFSQRVFSAYSGNCAMCIRPSERPEAVHISPTSEDADFNATSNGIALCKSHRRAFESGQIYIGDNYQIAFNNRNAGERTQGFVAAKTPAFMPPLSSAIFLPHDRRFRPSETHLRRFRRVHGIESVVS